MVWNRASEEKGQSNKENSTAAVKSQRCYLADRVPSHRNISARSHLEYGDDEKRKPHYEDLQETPLGDERRVKHQLGLDNHASATYQCLRKVQRDELAKARVQSNS